MVSYPGLQSFLNVILLVLFFSPTIKSQQSQEQRNDSREDTSQLCHCMEYWSCIGAGGKPYSYCNYNKVCCFVDKNSRSVGILPRKAKVSKCGEKGQDNGREGIAEPGEWAWQAAILEIKDDVYVCGASLLDEYWIMTAAHCVDDYSIPSELKVRLGEFDVSSTTEPLRHEEFEVERIVLNPEFNNNTLAHDIALVRMSRAARRKPNINTVCMPDKGLGENELIQADTKCYVTGWGRRTEASGHSVVLKEVNVPIWKSGDCEKALKELFGPTFHLPNTCICAGAEGKDACDGDGGGPLVCEKHGHWYQIGIVSYGVGCGRPNAPGVYTKVDSYKKWIHKVVLHS